MPAFWKLLVWLDRLANDKFMRGRWETISGRCYRRLAKGCMVCKWLCGKLDHIDQDHCKNAFLSDRADGNPNKLPWI